MSSLLPPNSTTLERNLADATRVELPVPLRELWNPKTCPVEVLPWLAWAWSIDHWESEWSEHQKRTVIADAVYMHRHKGTRGAVKRALSSLGFEATVSEWFEHDGAPYTFRLELASYFAHQADFDRFIRLIDSAKNVRSQLEVVAQRRTITQPLTIAIAVQTAQVSIVNLPTIEPNSTEQPLVLGGAIHAAHIATIGAAISIAIAARPATVAGIYQTATITTIHEDNHG